MAQNPWDKVPVVRDRRQNEREQAETRYRNTTGDANPLAQPVILPGEEGYAGPGQYLPDAGVVVRRQPWEDVPVASERPISGRLEAFASAATEQIPFLDEAAAGLTGLITGTPYSEVRALQGDLRNFDRENYGAERAAGGIAGFGAGLAAPGGAYIQGATRGAQVGRAALVGGAYGSLYGAGAGDDTYAGRLTSALAGGATGAIGGAVVQRGAQLASPYVQRLTSIAGNSFGRGVPEVTAARRLVAGVDPVAATAERSRLQSLGLEPSLMDVTGGTSERAVRAAAGPAGPAAELAVENMVARQANLKPEVMGVTRSLSSDPRSASMVREGLEEARDALATSQYREPYAAQVALTPEAARAIRGGGQSAIREAIQDELASPNFDANVVAELEGLLTADLDRLPSVSGRALDRVRIALRDTSAGLMRGDRPNRTRARGFAERVEGVDTALDAAPGLTEARATYRNLSAAAEAIDTAQQVFSTDPQEFATLVRNLTPEQREAMIIGVRQEILDTLGGQRQAGTGSLQTLSEAPYASQNLEALLGPREAQQYLGSIRARVAQTQRAARVSPNTGSQSFGRAVDEVGAVETVAAALDGVRALSGDAMAGARSGTRLANLSARMTMTPQVRESIVRLGIGSADELERVLELAGNAQANGRPPPRVVRAYLAKVQGQLGSQSPVAVQLERLLLPAPVSATEEQ